MKFWNNLLVQEPRKIVLYWDLMEITMCCAFWRCALGFCVFFIVFMGAPVPQGCSQMSAGVEGKGSAHCGVVLVAISGRSYSFVLLLVLFLITLLDNQVTNEVS